MKKAAWLRITIPIMAFLIIWQPVTGLNLDRIGDRLFLYAHVLPGALLVILALFHIGMNWTWVVHNYFKKRK